MAEHEKPTGQRASPSCYAVGRHENFKLRNEVVTHCMVFRSTTDHVYISGPVRLYGAEKFPSPSNTVRPSRDEMWRWKTATLMILTFRMPGLMYVLVFNKK